jgi:hypothetical protein
MVSLCTYCNHSNYSHILDLRNFQGPPLTIHPLDFFLMFLNYGWHLENMDNPFFWIYINFDPLNWRSLYVTRASVWTPYQTSLLIPMSIENTRCFMGHSFVCKLLGSKTVPLFDVSYTSCSTSCSFQDLNSCFASLALDPFSELQISSHHLIHIVLLIYISFIFLYASDFNPCSLHRFNLHFLLLKDLEIQIFFKNPFFWILTFIERNAFNKTKPIPIFFLFVLL